MKIEQAHSYDLPAWPSYLPAQTHAGYPLVLLDDRSQQTKRVHVYGPQWELQAEGYEPVMHKQPLAK